MTLSKLITVTHKYGLKENQNIKFLVQSTFEFYKEKRKVKSTKVITFIKDLYQ
jgi:hypothetical protein